MSSVVNDLLRRRNDPGYLNWLAVADALMFLSDGLRPYAENKMKELHALITTNVGGPGVKCPCSCVPGKKSKSNPHGRATPCTWAQQLRNFHSFSNKNDIPWHQSLGSQWHDPVHGYWEIAKLFMCDLGKNWATVKDAKCTDVGPLLNLLRFCKYFKIQHSSLDAVKDWRNKCAHAAPERTLSDIDKQNAFKDIESLLNDPELAGIKEVQDLRHIIKKTEMADISVLQSDELKIIQEFSRECQIETQAEVREVSKKMDKLERVVNEFVKGDDKSLVKGTRNLVKDVVSAISFILSFAVSLPVRKMAGMLWSLMVFCMFSQVGERNLMLDYGKIVSFLKITSNACCRPKK